MTLEELKIEISRLKIEAFDTIRTNRNIDPKFTGHKSVEHRAADTIEQTANKIEKMLKKWERDNPD